MPDQLAMDLSQPLHSPVHNLELRPEERRVLELIRTGRGNARQAKELAELTGQGEVTTRQIIRHLRMNHNCLIVSATTKPAGYYFPADAAENGAGIRQIVNRIRALRQLLDEMDRQTAEKIFGQKNYLDDLEKAS